AVRRKSKELDHSREISSALLLVYEACCARFHVPEPKRPITAGRSQNLAVRRKGRELDLIRMSLQPAFFARQNIPNPNNVVTGSPRSNDAPVRRKERVEAEFSTGQFEELLAGGDVPEMERAVWTTRHKDAAIRGEL